MEAELRLARHPTVTVRLPLGSTVHEVAVSELPSEANGTIGA